MIVTESDGLTEVCGSTYRLLLELDAMSTAPYAILQDPAGQTWSALNLLSSVPTVDRPDEVYAVGACTVETGNGESGGEDVVVVVRTRSTAWAQHELRLVCRPETLELSVTVTGEGWLGSVQLLGGQGTLVDGAAGAFASSIAFASVLVPAPGEPVQLVRPAHSGGQLGLVGDASPGRLHSVFSPPPLVFGFGRAVPTGPTSVPPGDWLGVGLRAPVAELTFTTLAYVPQDGGFHLELAYEGHTEVRGTWRTPVLVLRPAATGWAVLEDYHRDLLDAGQVPASATAPDARPAWWAEPLFCGWGAQCARVGVDADSRTTHSERGLTASAASQSRQDVYDTFLAGLAAHGIHPGTVVLDDRWQAAYGTAEPDSEHWPDLRGWIADQHRQGRRVLLWWKAWDPAGLPAQECVRDAAGRPVAADPANPRYLQHLTDIVTALLGADGLDADGLKIDFTQRAPSGRSLRAHPGVWGIAALHAMLAALTNAAHAAKPDALVVCHTVHPAFADVCDMVRLNDVAHGDIHGVGVPVVDQLRMRHAIASRMLPDHLIDTDQWPMPDRAEWRRYVEHQTAYGVPALYYCEAIDRTGELLGDDDLAAVAASWRRYREGRSP